VWSDLVEGKSKTSLEVGKSRVKKVQSRSETKPVEAEVQEGTKKGCLDTSIAFF
jgi:hypothetical protein